MIQRVFGSRKRKEEEGKRKEGRKEGRNRWSDVCVILCLCE